MPAAGDLPATMDDVLSESEIYVHAKRYLRNCGWTLVGGEPPGGSDGLPRVEAKHPDHDVKGSLGSKKVDLIAHRDGHLLLLELKSRYDRQDVTKLDELVGQLRWRRSLRDALLERNALDRANVDASTLVDRIASGEALVKALGLGHGQGVPDEYALLVFRSATDIEPRVGRRCPLELRHFETSE